MWVIYTYFRPKNRGVSYLHKGTGIQPIPSCCFLWAGSVDLDPKSDTVLKALYPLVNIQKTMENHNL